MASLTIIKPLSQLTLPSACGTHLLVYTEILPRADGETDQLALLPGLFLDEAVQLGQFLQHLLDLGDCSGAVDELGDVQRSLQHVGDDEGEQGDGLPRA